MIQKCNKGDIFYYDFGKINLKADHIEKKRRPALVVSNNMNNVFSTNVNIVPITTRTFDKCKKWQVYFNDNGRHQVILCEQVFTVSYNELDKYIGHIDEITLKEVDKALAIQFGLNTTQNELNSIEFMKRLDGSIEKILHDKLELDDKYIKHVVSISDEIKNNHDEHLIKTEKLMSDRFANLSVDVLNSVDIIQQNFNKYNKELSFILTSLMGLYQDIGQNKDELSSKGVNMVLEGLDKGFKTRKINANGTINSDTNDVLETKSKSNDKNIVTHRILTGYNIQDCLDFIKEYNSRPIDELCDKYNVTKKKLYNRNYAVKKYLNEHNVAFEDIKYRKGTHKK